MGSRVQSARSGPRCEGATNRSGGRARAHIPGRGELPVDRRPLAVGEEHGAGHVARGVRREEHRDHPSRPSQYLKTTRQVRPLADDRLLPGPRPRRSGRRQPQDPWRSPEAASERLSAAAQPRHRGHYREPGPDARSASSSCAVGQPKIRQHAVAHVLRDMPAPAPDRHDTARIPSWSPRIRSPRVVPHRAKFGILKAMVWRHLLSRSYELAVGWCRTWIAGRIPAVLDQRLRLPRLQHHRAT